MINSVVSVTRDSDDTPIEVTSVSLSIDKGSWGWSADVSIPGKDNFDLVDPSNGPVSITITLNGYDWVISLYTYSMTRGWPNRTYRLQGRSPTSALAAPEALPTSYMQPDYRTAVQLVEDELPYPYTLDWQLDPTEWQVPGGAYSYENFTPMQSITRIVETVKGFVQTDRNGTTLVVHPRFPAPPWQWTDTYPGDPSASLIDYTINLAEVAAMGSTWRENVRFNTIYVRGENEHGIQAQVYRADEGRDRPAPEVVDALITDSPGVGTAYSARMRGTAELGESGKWLEVTLSMPLAVTPDDPLLITPGMFVEFIDPIDGNWRGHVTGVTINATRNEGAVAVWQDLTIERYMDA
jgi:hypothetical protein